MTHRPSGPSATSLALTIAIFSALPVPVRAQTAPAHWVGCWGADPSFPTGPEVSKQTVRQVVRLSASRRWPDVLAERLAAAKMERGVVDAGISGNRVLHDLREAHFGPSALARFDRDVLAVPAVGTVILLDSINGIGRPGNAGLPNQRATADDIIAGLRQLADRAHDHGLRIVGATLTPFADTTIPDYFTPAGEADRQVVNRWVRDGGAFDGVIDFDAALGDPARPDHMSDAYDSGDHLHPNDAGYRKMGERST
jgi:lysophospholipase L1-like esterase